MPQVPYRSKEGLSFLFPAIAWCSSNIARSRELLQLQLGGHPAAPHHQCQEESSRKKSNSEDWGSSDASCGLQQRKWIQGYHWGEGGYGGVGGFPVTHFGWISLIMLYILLYNNILYDQIHNIKIKTKFTIKWVKYCLIHKISILDHPDVTKQLSKCGIAQSD